MREGIPQKIENGAIEVFFDADKSVHFEVMKREANIKTAEECLADAGFPLKFSPTNKKSILKESADKPQADNDDLLKRVYDSFGRENVELVSE
jgi:hypothetical protein